MTRGVVLRILKDIKYKDWKIELLQEPLYGIRLHWKDTDSVTGKFTECHSRVWYMPNHPLTKSEVVNTVFKAIMNAEEHETRERFRYQGKRLYNPHTNVEKLLEVCDDET